MDPLDSAPLALTASAQSLGSFSLAPSDASNQLVIDELSAISQMVESKNRELHIREQSLLKYKSKLNSEVLQAQRMLETLALALCEEGEAKISSGSESILKRINAALDSADLRVSQKRQTKEQLSALETKNTSLEETIKDLKIKLQHQKSQIDNFRSELDSKQTLLDHTRTQLNAATKAFDDLKAKIPAQTQKTSASCQTDCPTPPVAAPPQPPPPAAPPQFPPSIFGGLRDLMDSDALVHLACRFLLESPSLPAEIQTFIVDALFGRLALMVFSGELRFPRSPNPENVDEGNLLNRARMEVLRKRLNADSLVSDEQLMDVKDCTVGPVLVSARPGKVTSAYGRVLLFSCPNFQADVAEKLRVLTPKSPKLATLLFALTRGPLDPLGLEDRQGVKAVAMIDIDALANFVASGTVIDAIRSSEFLIHKLFEQALQGKQVAAIVLVEVASGKHRVWVEKLIEAIDAQERGGGKKPHTSLLKRIVKRIQN